MEMLNDYVGRLEVKNGKLKSAELKKLTRITRLIERAIEESFEPEQTLKDIRNMIRGMQMTEDGFRIEGLKMKKAKKYLLPGSYVEYAPFLGEEYIEELMDAVKDYYAVVKP